MPVSVGKSWIAEPTIIIERLSESTGQIQARAFLFDDKGTRPKQVNKATRPVDVECLHPLFENGNLFARNAENGEKLIVKGLGLTLLVALTFPFIGEMGGVRSDFRTYTKTL